MSRRTAILTHPNIERNVRLSIYYNSNKYPCGFYVYCYLRPNGTPYYFGKGQKRRAWDKKYHPLPKNSSLIIIIESNLSEIGALALERRMIEWWGRKNNKTGILVNMTEGGEGFCGYKQTNSHKEKLSNAAYKRWKDSSFLSKNLKKWQITSPSGEKFVIQNLNNFCMTNDLNQSLMSKVSKGLRPHHKGWKVIKI